MTAPEPDAPRGLTLRPFREADRPSVQQLVEARLDASWAEIVRPSLEAALGGAAREARGLAAHAGGALVGVVVFGDIAGSLGTARLHLVAVASHAQRGGVGRTLVFAAGAELARAGGRLLMVEMPDDPALASALTFLLRAGFEEEARIPDFYRDGVALVFLRRPLGDA